MFDGSNLSVTTPAVARPEIVEITLASFSKNLKNVSLKDIDLFINVDPIPKDKQKVEAVIDIGKHYFRTVYARTPPYPNLAVALKWTWQQANTDFILSLEDDWTLDVEVDTKVIYDSFIADPKLVQYVLRAYDYEYVLIPGSPSFFSRVFYKSYAEKFLLYMNYEKQFRLKEMWPFPDVHQLVYGEHPIITDIGKKWYQGHGLKKPDLKIDFTTYTNNNEFR
jgi:hypothetical protein